MPCVGQARENSSGHGHGKLRSEEGHTCGVQLPAKLFGVRRVVAKTTQLHSNAPQLTKT